MSLHYSRSLCARVGLSLGPDFIRRLLLCCVCYGTLSGTSTIAQEGGVAALPPTLRAVRLESSEQLQLDGVLDEPVWQRAIPAQGFLQREPATGMPATESTDVRVVYEARRVVLGVILHDSEPHALLQNQMQRDGSFDGDDSFAWVIDSFLDGRTGYFFEINPAGAMGDGLVTLSAGGGGGRGGGGGGGGGGGAGGGGDRGAINRSWDGIWTARVRRTATGWAAEIEIPFRTLNFNPDLTTWGINFRRTIRRKNEESLWTSYALNQGLSRIVNAGRVEGLNNVSQGLGLDVKPYAVAHVSSAPGSDRPAAIAKGDIGLDAFYNITPALQMNLSVNTDFAETEVDERRVNLTRFPLFFEEKRDFFLEGSSYFDFARMPGRAITPFFSRHIGRDARGQAQRIDAGGKLTGRAGAFDIGILQVRTAERPREDQIGEDFSVIRVRRRMFEQSYVGAVYTRRDARLAGEDRQTAGLDLGFSTSRFRGTQNLDFSAFYLWTSNPFDPNRSSSFGTSLRYPNDPWTASFSALELQPGYDPAVGFVERRGIRQYQPEFEWSPRLDNHPWIRSIDVSMEANIQTDMQNALLTRELEFTVLQINPHDGARYQFRVSPQFERLEEDFEISDGIVLPAGNVYQFTRYEIDAQTPEHLVVSVSTEFEWGDFFSGRRRDIGLRLDVRPRRGLSLSADMERSFLDLAEGSFVADVYRADASTQFSPWLSVANRLQYDSVSREVGWQVRFRWIRRPGNDIYFVYTHNWHEIRDSAERYFTTLDNRLASKLVYTLRF